MCTQLMWHASLKVCMHCVMQGDPADSVFFIEEGDCQVGYNQRRTADEDLISTVSNFPLVCTGFNHILNVKCPCLDAQHKAAPETV